MWTRPPPGCIPGLLAALVALAAPGGGIAGAAAADSAVIVMYHRFGEGQIPATSISLARFEAHIEELTRGGYAVLPLPEIVEALAGGRPLPENAVGISVDDAFLSAHAEAWPRLRKAGLPFTLFAATDPLDGAGRAYMSWAQLRDMAAAGVAVGAHTASHLHMATAAPEVVRRAIEKSNARFEAELGARPRLFAYPYGESSLAVQALVREAGYVAAFGQHSGVAYAGGDLFDLPRFAFNDSLGDPARFRTVVRALALAAVDLTPLDSLVGAINPPAIGFTVTGGIGGLERLACFASHEGRARVERLAGTRVEVRLASPLPKGRSRINCTLPAADGRWRWWGRQFYVAP